MNYNRMIAVGALLGAVACGGDNNNNPGTDATVTDTSTNDGGTGGPNTCAPRAASGGAAAARALQARGFGGADTNPLALVNYSVDFFLNGVVTAACTAPNCVSAVVDAQGNVSANIPPDWYAYRVVDPSGTTVRAGVPTYGFNRIPAGAGMDIVYQVSSLTRGGLLAQYGRSHASGSAAIAGGAVNAQGLPRMGATARIFVNGTQISNGQAMTDAFVGYFSGPANNPSPSSTATSISENGRWAAANLPTGSTGATVRVEIVENGTVVGCEEGSLFPNAVSLLNIGALRSDYQSCSGCYQYRVSAGDAGVTDATTSDATTTTDATTSDATTTTDATTSDATVADTSTNG